MFAPGSTNVPIAKFPASNPSPSTDTAQVAATVISSVNAAIAATDYPALSNLFVAEGFWRDHLALTWDFRTAQGPSSILEFLKQASGSSDGFRLKKVEVDAATAFKAPKLAPLDPEGKVVGVQFFIKVQTAIGNGPGVASLVEVDGQWKIFSLYTSLRELKGHEEGVDAHRPVGVQHGQIPGRTNWAERRALAADYKDGSEPAVFVLG